MELVTSSSRYQFGDAMGSSRLLKLFWISILAGWQRYRVHRILDLSLEYYRAQNSITPSNRVACKDVRGDFYIL